MKKLPSTLQEYIESLPGAMVNNAREIVQATWKRLTTAYPHWDTNRSQGFIVAKIMDAKFGTDLLAEVGD